MNCEPCTRAERNPRAYDYAIGCDSCSARALAATGAHEASQALGSLTEEYRDALQKVFGAGWELKAELVKGWGKKLTKGQT